MTPPVRRLMVIVVAEVVATSNDDGDDAWGPVLKRGEYPATDVSQLQVRRVSMKLVSKASAQPQSHPRTTKYPQPVLQFHATRQSMCRSLGSNTTQEIAAGQPIRCLTGRQQYREIDELPHQAESNRRVPGAEVRSHEMAGPGGGWMG